MRRPTASLRRRRCRRSRVRLVLRRAAGAPPALSLRPPPPRACPLRAPCRQDPIDESILAPLVTFAKDSKDLLDRCDRPTASGACGAPRRARASGPRGASCLRVSPAATSPPFLHADFYKIAMVTGAGFLVLGVVGCAIKLVHIPITNLL